MSEQSNGLHDALTAAVEPIKQQLAIVEKEIAELEAELAQKRKDRTAARNVLRVLDPESVPKSEQVKPKTLIVSDEKVEALAEHLRQRSDNGAPFKASDLEPELKGVMSRATLNNALNVLADRGLIRLDSMKGIGGAKHYKTTRALRA